MVKWFRIGFGYGSKGKLKGVHDGFGSCFFLRGLLGTFPLGLFGLFWSKLALLGLSLFGLIG